MIVYDLLWLSHICLKYFWVIFAVRFLLSGYAVGAQGKMKPTLIMDMKLLLVWLLLMVAYVLLPRCDAASGDGFPLWIFFHLSMRNVREMCAALGPAYLVGWLIGNRVGRGYWIPGEGRAE